MTEGMSDDPKGATAQPANDRQVIEYCTSRASFSSLVDGDGQMHSED